LQDLVRPNPANQINVRNQAQLEAELGPDLIIPAGETVIVSIDKSFTLSKPFKKQNASNLFLKAPSLDSVLTYDEVLLGALFQMDSPSDIGGITQLDNVTISGNFGNECFALNDSLFNISNTVVIQNFSSLGTITAQLVKWTTVALISNLKGIAFIDTAVVDMNMTGNSQLLPFITTLMSFISTGRMDVVIENSQHVADGLNNEFLFLDPNTSVDSSFKIRDSGIISDLSEALFQKGVDVAVDNVANVGGKIECTAIGHDMVNNTYAVLSGFTESTYNRTSLITVVDAARFIAEDIDFIANDTGNVNRSSLDQTDPRVIAETNPDQPDSMTLAESRSVNDPLTIPVIQNTFVPIQQSPVVADDFIEDPATERYTISNLTGIITYIGAAPITVVLTFELSIQKASGGDNAGAISLFKNGVQETKTDQFFTISTSSTKINYSGGIFQINPGDSFQLRVRSDTGTASPVVMVSALKVLMTLQ